MLYHGTRMNDISGKRPTDDGLSVGNNVFVDVEKLMAEIVFAAVRWTRSFEMTRLAPHNAAL